VALLKLLSTHPVASILLSANEAQQRLPRHLGHNAILAMSRSGIPLRQIVQVIRKPRLRSMMEVETLEVNSKRIIAVIDDLHRRATIRVLKSRDIERSAARNGSVNAVGSRADELLAEVGVRPQAAGDADLGGAVDEHEALVVGRVGRAPPVEVAVGVADGEEVVDVVRPGDAVALEAVTAGVPVVSYLSQVFRRALLGVRTMRS